MIKNTGTNRRTFLAGTALACGEIFSKKAFGAFSTTTGAYPIRVALDSTRTIGAIPSDFTGLGFEISSVAVANLLTAANHTYVQLVRNLGKNGVIRIGGNTSDYSSYEPQGKLLSTPKGTIVNEDSLRQLGSFLDATGWKLIWGLNLGNNTEQNAVEEARAIVRFTKDKLLAFEIGNEPDLFGHEGHRPRGYSYEDYLADYRRYKSAIRAALPGVPLAGPDVAGATDWAIRFAKDEGSDLKLLTHHYYRGGARNPASTLDLLLQSDLRLAPDLAKMKQAADGASIPFRICETNSFSGGGKPGVSDTLGSALWMLDYMLTVAWSGGGGVNMETGVNQLDFVSSYSPISDDGHGMYAAAPDYYGMLAFAQGGQGERLALDYDPGPVNVKIYAAAQDRGRMVLTIINKDVSRDVEIEFSSEQHFTHASVMRLLGQGLESRSGVTFAGAAVGADGTWRPAKVESITIRGKAGRIQIPAGSAAVVAVEARP
ncbi:glycosyl hydrolase family 79 C-terminal domain-containing protein [Edaphobacter paludis]|uniref:Glycosyl hydrolase family 79 C-terminal domain-containing protein n=1 Tax=Edaphobacter paludis TaxID=3035702 RepID=A0AAU7D1K1_9BACT